MQAAFPTEFPAALAVLLILAVTLVHLSLNQREVRGLRDGAAGLVLLGLHALAVIAWDAHGSSSGLSFTVAKVLQVAGAACLLVAARRFQGRPPALVPVWAVAVLGGAAALLGGLSLAPGGATRALVDGVVLGMFAAAVLTFARAGMAPGTGSRHLAPARIAAGAMVLWMGTVVAPVAWLVPSTVVLGTLTAVGLVVIGLQRRGSLLDDARRQAKVSERNAADRAQHLREVLDSLSDGMIAVDEDGIIVDLNGAAETMFGYAAADLKGREAAFLLPWIGAPERAGGLIDGISGDPDFWASLPVGRRVGVRFDGKALPVDLTVSSVSVGDGRFRVCMVRDVSRQIMKERLDTYLHDLDGKAYRMRSTEALGAEACADLAGVFDVPLVALAEWSAEAHLTLRHLHGASDEPSLWDALETFLERDDRISVALRELLQDGEPRLLRDLPAPLDRYGWATALCLAGSDQPRGVVLLAGGDAEPGAASRQQMRTAVARLAAALQAVSDQQQLRLQGTAMAAAANAIFITDVTGRIEWVNEAFTRLSGYAAREVIGKHPNVLRSGMQDDAFYRALWDTILAGHVWRGELIERRKDGSLYSVEQTVAPILDEDGRIAHFVAVHEDVTSRKEAEQQVVYLANYDMLTRLPNRAQFRDRLYEAVAQRRTSREKMAVLFIDLDKFQRVNDTLGHDVGDQLLMTVASRINAAAAAESDTVARIGGDEFAVIQTDLPSNEAAALLARKVINAVKQPVDLDGLEVQVGANVGIAIFPQDGEDPDHLIKNADMAMYRAIRAEGEEFFFFSNDMNDEARQRLGLEGDLRRAVENGDMELYYQPQIEVSSRRVVGVEALLRWTHAEKGPISPARFIPVAEDSGLILPLGEWVLHEAARQAAEWQRQGLPPLTMAVNISAVQFRQQDLVGQVRDILASTTCDPGFLELELTESMLMQDASGAVRVLRELSDIGAQLAIDDFGTGYSSLSYLKQFPVDKLKLDQSFVHQLPDDTNDAVIARATINLGHSLGMEVIAEGVETEAQFAYLRNEGCDVVQGFLFGRPMPPADLAVMLAQDAASGDVRIPAPAGGDV